MREALTKPAPVLTFDALDEVATEVVRQDRVHPAGWPATRDGIRLGLAAMEDELREALDAWRNGRCKCVVPDCGHHDWSEVAAEAVQVAAVAVGVVRSIRSAKGGTA